MMRYLQADMLKDCGINHFDEWAADFGEVKTDYEHISLCSKMIWGLKNKPCKRNNRQNSDNTKNAAKQGNAEERPDAGCGIKR